MDIELNLIQQEFDKACHKGNLTTMLELIDQGAQPLPISLSLAGEYYPTTKEAFDWLLEHCDDIDWTYICNNPHSQEMAEKIVNKGHSIDLLASIAIHYGDIPLFRFAITKIGWQPNYLKYLAELHVQTFEEIQEQCNLFNEGLNNLYYVPTKGLFDIAKKNKNYELAILIRNKYFAEENRNALINFWKKNGGYSIVHPIKN